MKKKRILVLLVITVLLALVYLQFREWRRFDWAKFREGTAGVNYLQVLFGVALVYLADFLRAVRWKIFMRPGKPDASWTGLISPQYVGFTGLALLGRPGELVRPYLIARKENVSFPSQLAIWFVERAFDIGAVTLIVAVDIFFVPSIRDRYPEWRVAGWALIAMFLGFALAQVALWSKGAAIAGWVRRRFSSFSPHAGATAEKRLLAVSAGMHTLKDVTSFLQATGISLVIWWMLAMAYREVLHAYPADTGLPGLHLPEAILLMGASVAGGVLQLPVVGGGSQLATIAVLNRTFCYTDTVTATCPAIRPERGPELAVSCGILLWLVTFIAVVPVGLVLARREHISLRALSHESEEEAKEAAPPNGGG